MSEYLRPSRQAELDQLWRIVHEVWPNAEAAHPYLTDPIKPNYQESI